MVASAPAQLTEPRRAERIGLAVLSDRDRRLLLIGVLTATGAADVLGIHVPAAHTNGELTAQQLREIVIFLSHYAGWPNGAKLNTIVEDTIAKAAKE